VIAGRSFVSVVDDDESVRESLGAHPFRGSCHLVRRTEVRERGKQVVVGTYVISRHLSI